MRAAARYLKIVEWDEADQCFVGRCPGLFLGGCHGDDEAKVYAELCGIVEETVADIQANGEPLPAATAGKNYSGKFLLRTGESLHQQLYLASLKSGVSLNKFCVQSLEKDLG